jgi:hypothetical protein
MNQISRDQQGKWYSPQPRPNYRSPLRPGHEVGGPGQASGGPVGPSPQATPTGLPDALAAVKGIGVRFSVTAGLLFGGFVIAAIALFLPWVTVSVNSPLGGGLYKTDASPFQGGWIFVILLVIGVATWLAWPTISGSKMGIPRLAGLTATVGLQIVFLLIGFVSYVNGVSEKNKIMTNSGEDLAGLAPDVSIQAGMFLYAVAIVAIVAGLVRIWKHRSR